MSGLRGLVRRGRDAAPAVVADPGPRRRERQPDEPLRIAALTVCRDEGRMLPLWLDYYGRQLGVENLYVVDDSSTDGSTEGLPCDVLRIPPVRDGKFETTRMGVLAGLGRALLELYDAVIFCDADEFLVPDPQRWSGLREYVASRGEDVGAVAALGLNVVHAVDAEEPLDLSRPVLGQRRLAKLLPVMCKPAVKFVAAPWYAASHGIRTPYSVDPDLWMFHLKFADRDLLREAADRRREAVAEDGRSRNTSWRRGGEEMVALLEEVVAGVSDPGSVAELVPPTPREAAALVVEEEGRGWRAPKGSQVELMRHRPLVRIPDRFHGLV